MSRVSRRDLLRSLGAVALASIGLGARPGEVLAREADARQAVRVPPGWDYPAALRLPFAHGVASGDPLARRVILWTRLTAPGVPTSERVPVRWSVAKNPQMRRVVAGGTVGTGAKLDWTVKEFAPSSIGRGGADEAVRGQIYDARYGDGPVNRETFESPEMVAAGIAGSRPSRRASAPPTRTCAKWTGWSAATASST